MSIESGRQASRNWSVDPAYRSMSIDSTAIVQVETRLYYACDLEPFLGGFHETLNLSFSLLVSSTSISKQDMEAMRQHRMKNWVLQAMADGPKLPARSLNAKDLKIQMFCDTSHE